MTSSAVAGALNLMAYRSDTSTLQPWAAKTSTAAFLAAALNEPEHWWAYTINTFFSAKPRIKKIRIRSCTSDQELRTRSNTTTIHSLSEHGVAYCQTKEHRRKTHPYWSQTPTVDDELYSYLVFWWKELLILKHAHAAVFMHPALWLSYTLTGAVNQ